MNVGILALLSVTALVLAGFARFFAVLVRRARAAATPVVGSDDRVTPPT
jgi:hypothetical protein